MHYVHNNKNFIEKMKTSAHKQLENIKCFSRRQKEPPGVFYKKSCSLKFRNTTASEKKIDRRVKTSIFKDEVLVKETIQEPPIKFKRKR